MEIRAYFDLASFVHKSVFLEIKHPWEALDNLQEYLHSYSTGVPLTGKREGVFLKNPETIFLEESVVIEPGAYIQGPCVIGARTVVRHGAYIRGGTLIGSDCVIGHASEVKGSILLNAAKVPHFNYCGDSILGNDTNMGAGSITANVRFDRKEISSTAFGERTRSFRTKFGLILADGAQLGCNVVTPPGTVIEKGVWIPPQTNLTGVTSHDRQAAESRDS